MKINIESKFNLGEKVYFFDSNGKKIYEGVINKLYVEITIGGEYYRYKIFFYDEKSHYLDFDIYEGYISFDKEKLERDNICNVKYLDGCAMQSASNIK